MKILQIITSLSFGGAEKLILDSVPLYQKKGLVVDVLCLNSHRTAFTEELERKYGFKVNGLTEKSVYNPLLIFKIIPYLKKYDVVHAHLFPTLYWVVLAKWISFSKVKIVYTEHSTNNRRRNNKILSLTDRFIYSKLNHISCISDSTLVNLTKHLKLSLPNMNVIYNGIHLNKFIKENLQFTNLDFFDKDSYVLIQVSSFREQKDQTTLIKSLQYLPQSIKLLLVGDGYLKVQNENLVSTLGLKDRVFFLGLRNDIPELLNYSDICILSSNYEGFGLAIVEGMASKLPCIATNVDGIKEVVEGYGLLFERGNVKELANLITKLTVDKEFYAKVAQQCFERAQDFDINNMIDQYISLYKKVNE